MIVAGGIITAADIVALQALTTGKALVRLVQQVTQPIPTGTATALTFGAGSEDVDTHGWHDTAVNTARITPIMSAPAYLTFGGSYVTQAMTTPVSRTLYVRKNGTIALPPGPRDGGATITTSREVHCPGILMNGTTDYVELVGQQSSSGSVSTSVATQLTSIFYAIYERPQ